MAHSLGFDKLNLRCWLLFWDVLAIVASPYHTDEEYFLEKAGVLRILNFKWDMRFLPHEQLFCDLEASSPGCWSLATLEKYQDPLHERERQRQKVAKIAENERALLVRLYSAIPIPSAETSLADLLEFKVKREDELVRMRVEIERIYQRVLSSGDRELAAVTEADGLHKAINDVIRVSNERGWRLEFGGLEAKIKWELGFDDLFVAVAAGAVAGHAFGPVGGAVGAAAGAGSALIPKLELSTGPGFSPISRTATPYEYVGLAHKELQPSRNNSAF